MHTKPRGGASIDKIVIHDPEGANTARELYNYLQRISAGYHAMPDDYELIVAAADDLIVEGAGGMNTHALHICFVPGRAAWSRAEWLVHRQAIERGAVKIAEWCKLHDIPARWLTPAEVATDGVKGLCTHGDVTAAGYTASQGHTDPGLNFPRDVLLDAVNATLKPAAPKEVDDVLTIPCPNRPAPSPTTQPHAQFLPPSQLFPAGAVALRHGARIKGAKQQSADLWIWAPPLIAKGRKWVSMMEKIGELPDNDPNSDRSRGVILVDDHGDTTTVEQGLWI